MYKILKTKLFVNVSTVKILLKKLTKLSACCKSGVSKVIDIVGQLCGAFKIVFWWIEHTEGSDMR